MDLWRTGFRGELKEQDREGGSLPSGTGWVCAVGKGCQGLGVGRMVMLEMFIHDPGAELRQDRLHGEGLGKDILWAATPLHSSFATFPVPSEMLAG